jgi:hypothetical protein
VLTLLVVEVTLVGAALLFAAGRGPTPRLIPIPVRSGVRRPRG